MKNAKKTHYSVNDVSVIQRERERERERGVIILPVIRSVIEVRNFQSV